jgi:DUF4097 and DUF4098 domain-containing protein YvlB
MNNLVFNTLSSQLYATIANPTLTVTGTVVATGPLKSRNALTVNGTVDIATGPLTITKSVTVNGNVEVSTGSIEITNTELTVTGTVEVSTGSIEITILTVTAR